jgi:prepilin-type N-terminal cleavage/methylation domain-containing protein
MSRNRGFSLLESVVALAILGTAGAAALESLAAELRSAERTRRALESNALAVDRLARLRLLPREELVPLADSLRRGIFPAPFEGYRWTIATRTVSGADDLVDVRIVIHWEGGAEELATRLYRGRR